MSFEQPFSPVEAAPEEQLATPVMECEANPEEQERAMVRHALEYGEINLLGPAHLKISGILPSHNEVTLATANVDPRELPEFAMKNTSTVVLIHDGDQNDIMAIFKPRSGEDAEQQGLSELKSIYPRETLAGQLCNDVLGFRIVPQITTRTTVVAGKQDIGSLQELIDPEQLTNLDKYIKTTYDTPLEDLYENPDFLRSAALGFILGSADAHAGNFLIDKTALTSPELAREARIYAIDHGLALSTILYSDATYFADPAFYLTATLENDKRRGDVTPITEKETPIPDWLREELQAALDSWDERITGLSQTIESDVQINGANSHSHTAKDELSFARMRLEALLASGKFLSKVNCNDWLSADHPKMPQLTERDESFMRK